MTIYAGHNITLHISEFTESPSYSALKGVRVCRWHIEHAMEETMPVGADNWVRKTVSTRRSLSIRCELVGASHAAQVCMKRAALNGDTLRARLTLAGGETLEGEMQVERYEETAREDELLEVETQLVSVGAITVTE